MFWVAVLRSGDAGSCYAANAAKIWVYGLSTAVMPVVMIALVLHDGEDSAGGSAGKQQ
jgi:hypothetical protein